MQSQLLGAWKLGLTTSHKIPSLLAPNMTQMSTWHHFLELRFWTCVESRIKQKILCIKKSRSYRNHVFNGFLRLKSWDSASMLELVDMSGTWDPM